MPRPGATLPAVMRNTGAYTAQLQAASGFAATPLTERNHTMPTMRHPIKVSVYKTNGSAFACCQNATITRIDSARPCLIAAGRKPHD